MNPQHPRRAAPPVIPGGRAISARAIIEAVAADAAAKADKADTEATTAVPGINKRVPRADSPSKARRIAVNPAAKANMAASAVGGVAAVADVIAVKVAAAATIAARALKVSKAAAQSERHSRQHGGAIIGAPFFINIPRSTLTS